MIVVTPGSSLLLSAIDEPSTNDLRLIVVEARPQARTVQTPVGLAQPVVPDATSRGFELTWWRYVAYAVRNESYAKGEVGEELGKSPVGTREDTAFLRYVSATTFAGSEYPGPLTHWFVYTEWQCIDIVSDTAPEVRELTTLEVEAAARSGLLADGPSVVRASPAATKSAPE